MMISMSPNRMKCLKRSLAWLISVVVLLALCPSAYAENDPVVLDGFITQGAAVFLMTDGTVRVLEDERLGEGLIYDELPLEECLNWTGITQLAHCNDVIVGLRSDGTVAAAGREDFVSTVSSWDHIVRLYGITGDYNVLAGLRDDGRVVITGVDPFATWDEDEDDDSEYFEAIESLQDVSKLLIGVCPAGGYYAALHQDGTVSPSWVYEDRDDLKGWSRDGDHFIDLDSSGWGIIALRDDGTCAVSGTDAYGYREITDTWTDLKQVACGDTFAIGLRNDGTFVTSRDDQEEWPDAFSEEFASLRDVDHFEMPGASNCITVYHIDGSVDLFYTAYDSGNEVLRSWTDIAKVLTDYSGVFIGIKTDGSLVSTLEGLQLDAIS